MGLPQFDYDEFCIDDILALVKKKSKKKDESPKGKKNKGKDKGKRKPDAILTQDEVVAEMAKEVKKDMKKQQRQQRKSESAESQYVDKLYIDISM